MQRNGIANHVIPAYHRVCRQVDLVRHPLRTNTFLVFFLVLITLILFRCSESSPIKKSVLGELKSPKDNPPSPEKIALGKKLFFDKRLSINNSISCATCHQPDKAFSDGKVLSRGVYGRTALRNAPSILNAAFAPRLMMDGEVKTLEMQVLVPVQDHNEMGMNIKTLVLRLRKIPEYAKAAKSIYEREFDPFVLTRSLAAFERTLISDNAPFDRFYYRNQKNAISADAQQGWKLFSGKLQCTACHKPPFFTTYETASNGSVTHSDTDLGRYRITGDSLDRGKFKIPSLRNVARTAPYMHNGQFKTLNEVLIFYQNGKTEGLNADKRLLRTKLSDQEKRYLLAFFKSLSQF